MASGYFKDLTRRTASDKILHDKAFSIAKIPKYAWYQKGLACVIYRFFDTDQLKKVITSLSNLNSKVDKLDVDKFEPASVVLSKLSDVVKKWYC